MATLTGRYVRGVYLEVGAGHTSRYLPEHRFLDLDELRGLNHVQDFFNLPEEHHLQTQRNVSTVKQTILLTELRHNKVQITLVLGLHGTGVKGQTL